MLRSIRHRLQGMMPLSRQARIVAAIVPPRHWYSIAIAAGRLHARLAQLLGFKDLGRRERTMRENWVCDLTEHGAFPIPYRVVGAECLVRTEGDSNGLLYCSVHIPMILAGIRALEELGAPPALIIAGPGKIRADGRMYPFGLGVGWPAVRAGARGMLAARSAFRKGQIVGSLLDVDTGGPLSPNLLRLAGKMGVRTVLLLSEVDENNVVIFTLVSPQCAVPDTEEKVQAVLKELEAHRDRILGRLRDAG